MEKSYDDFSKQDLTEKELDDKIDAWHEDENLTMPLYEYLDMTKEEYEKFVLR